MRQRVDELESTIRGLTQELVEANERIRQLEEEAEAHPETVVAGEEDGAGKANDPVESTKPMGTAMETEPDPGAESESATESDTPEETTEESDREESDDIIVA